MPNTIIDALHSISRSTTWTQDPIHADSFLTNTPEPNYIAAVFRAKGYETVANPYGMQNTVMLRANANTTTGRKPIRLKHGTRPTVAHDKLVAGLSPEGATVHRRKGGYSDYNVIRDLVHAGWLEGRPTGPRGGIRYFTTVAGNAALESTK